MPFKCKHNKIVSGFDQEQDDKIGMIATPRPRMVHIINALSNGVGIIMEHQGAKAKSRSRSMSSSGSPIMTDSI